MKRGGRPRRSFGVPGTHPWNSWHAESPGELPVHNPIAVPSETESFSRYRSRMPVIAVTRLRVRSWRYLPMFVVQSIRAARQAAASQGNRSTKLLRDQGKAFWTATSWSDEAAMKQFMHAPPHGPVMKKLLEWCDEAALVHWTQTEADIPSWVEAHARLQRDGRRSKVNHPSAAHDAFQIPAPAGRQEMRLK